MLLGVDVGGTFTDAVLVGEGTITTAKAPTTPQDQAAGVVDAVEQVLDRAGAAPSEVRLFAHGMTVATNALLEGHGARTVLVATEGFTDLVELGRQARADLYRLCAAHPAPIVPPRRRVGAPERMVPGGVLTALTDGAARAVADEVAGHEPEAVAVCLLHADRHPAHELALGRALAQRLPGVHVSLSHDVVGTFREHERAATTEVDATLSPLLAGYLGRLLERAEQAGLPAPSIMQSSGGLADADRAAAHAALTVLSGPAGGAAAAELLAAATGQADLLCFDMGGTSCDVCVVRDGRVGQTGGREVGGRSLALPMVDILTVGAGGGSVGWRDPGGALRVGPRSAGADPGPAAYGRGGTEPTVTDAHVVLGRLPADAQLGGLDLDPDAARTAVAGLAAQLGLDVEDCARGIVRVANAEMVRALRVMSVQRGVDPRGFALLAFGGAGALHAAEIADELGMGRVLAPRAGGVLSALGLAGADQRRDEVQTVLLTGGDLTAAAMAQAAGDADEVTWDARYAGQSHELSLGDVPPEPGALRAALAREHEERYGYAGDDGDVELVTVRRTHRTPGPELDLSVDDRAGEELVGPLAIARDGSTVWLPEGWHAREDATGTLVLERA